MSIFNKIFKRNTKTNSINAIFTNSSNVITNNDATSFAAVDLIASSIANLTGGFFTAIQSYG